MRLILLSLVSIFILGCSSKPVPTHLPFAVQTQIEIGGQVNPYDGVDSHPIVLRLYQLREPGAFNNADFLDIYLKDREVLGASLIDAQYLEPMLPGEVAMPIEVQRDTRYLAVFAEFADYRSAVGKAVLLLNDNPDQQIVTIQVNGLVVDITMKAKPKESWWW